MSTERYELRLAAGAEDVRAAQRLRFAVFNVELGEGLPGAEATGLDADDFDAVCDHLLVVERATGHLSVSAADVEGAWVLAGSCTAD